VQEPGLRAHMLGDVGEEGDDVVAGLGLDLVDALDLEGAARTDRLRRLARDQPHARLGLAGEGLDFEPDAKAGLRLPEGGHLGAAVAGDHGRAPRGSVGRKRRLVRRPNSNQISEG